MLANFPRKTESISYLRVFGSWLVKPYILTAAYAQEGTRPDRESQYMQNLGWCSDHIYKLHVVFSYRQVCRGDQYHCYKVVTGRTVQGSAGPRRPSESSKCSLHCY